MLRLDKIKATAHIVSIKAHKEMQNGEFVAVGKLDANAQFGAGEVFEVGNPSADSKKVVLVAGVELMADETLTVDEYKVAKDAVVRGIYLEKGDVISIPQSLVTSLPSSPEAGKFVVVGANTKPEYKAALAGSELVAMEILSCPVITGVKHVQLLVL